MENKCKRYVETKSLTPIEGKDNKKKLSVDIVNKFWYEQDCFNAPDFIFFFNFLIPHAEAVSC